LVARWQGHGKQRNSRISEAFLYDQTIPPATKSYEGCGHVWSQMIWPGWLAEIGWRLPTGYCHPSNLKERGAGFLTRAWKMILSAARQEI
jgi:hypothetical protein